MDKVSSLIGYLRLGQLAAMALPALVQVAVSHHAFVGTRFRARAFSQVLELDSTDIAAITILERDPDEQVRHQVEMTLGNIRLRGTAA